jgi:hypothetical protein
VTGHHHTCPTWPCCKQGAFNASPRPRSSSLLPSLRSLALMAGWAFLPVPRGPRHGLLLPFPGTSWPDELQSWLGLAWVPLDRANHSRLQAQLRENKSQGCHPPRLPSIMGQGSRPVSTTGLMSSCSPQRPPYCSARSPLCTID